MGAAVPCRSIEFNDPSHVGKARTLSGPRYGAGLGCFDVSSFVQMYGSVLPSKVIIAAVVHFVPPMVRIGFSCSRMIVGELLGWL